MKKILIFGIVILVLIGVTMSSSEDVLEFGYTEFVMNLFAGEEDPVAGFIGKSGMGMIWTINKTGAEVDLDVNYNDVNDTATEFCINAINKTRYLSELSKKSKDYKKIPLNKTKLSKEFSIDKTAFSVENKDSCFVVNHNNIDGLQFKLGWNSVLIDGSADALATVYGSNENLCIVNDKCHVAYEGGGSDLWYGNATYNTAGEYCEDDWSTVELLSGTVSQVGITCSPNGTITVHYISSSDLDMFQGIDGVFNGPTTVEDDIAIFTGPIGATVDSRNITHFCLIDSVDDIVYVNTSNLDAGREISGTDSDHCDIAVDADDNVFISITDSASGDGLDLMSSIDGYSTRNQWFSGANVAETLGSGVSIAICDDGTIYTSWIDNFDLQFCEGKVSDWKNEVACQEVDSTASVNPDIACSKSNNPYILYSSSLTGTSFLANRTSGGSFSARVTIPGGLQYMNIVDSVYATQNRMDKILNIIGTDTSASDVFYTNLSIMRRPNYDLNITDPTTSNPKTVASEDNITIGFKIVDENDGIQVTTGVTILNITIDGTEAEIPTELSPDLTLEIRSNYNASTSSANPTTVSFLSALSSTDYTTIMTANNTPADTVFSVTYLNKGTTSFQIKTEDDVGGNEGVQAINWIAIINGEYDINNSGGDLKCHSISSPGPTGTASFDSAFDNTDYALICNTIDDADSPLCSLISRSTGSWDYRIEDDTDATETVSELNYCAIKFGNYLVDGKEMRVGNSTYSGGMTGTFASNMPSTNYVVTTSVNMFSTDFTDPCSCEITAKNLGTFTATCATDGGSGCPSGRAVDWFVVEVIEEDLTLTNKTVKTIFYNSTDWTVNVTVPTKSDGTYDLFLNATIDGQVVNDTQVNAITYGAPPADTCSPSSPLSADHTFDCADDCTQSTELDAGGNNIFVLGTGSFTMTADIINLGTLSTIKGTDVNNRCFVTCLGGCFRS